MAVSQQHTYTQPGVKTIVATDSAGNTATAQVTVTGTGEIVLTPSSVPAGGTVTVTGTGFPANAEVTVTVRDSASTVVGTGTGTAGADGSLAGVDIVVDEAAALGQATVTAVSGVVTATAPLTVTSPLTPLPAPTGLTVTTTSDSALSATWTAVAGAVGYVVEYKTTAGTDWTALPQTTEVTQAITGLVTDTSYDVRVTAIGDGTTTGDSVPSAVVSATTAAPPALPVPANLAATATSATEVSATWDPVTGASGYAVQYRTGAAAWTPLDPATSPQAITGLTAETAYEVQVMAKGDGTTSSDSEWSASASVTTPAA